MLRNTIKKLFFLKKVFVVYLGVICFFVPDLLAQKIPSQQLQTSKFGTVYKKLNDLIKQEGAENIIFVLDDDNTILTTPDDNQLGGVYWWQWQSKLLGTKSPYAEAKNEDALLTIQKLLFELKWMVPTEESLPKAIHYFQKKGVTTIVLTARGPDMMDVTTSQFDHIVNGKYVATLDFTQSAIPPKHGYSDLFSCQGLSNKVAYHNGVMYLSGQDKGLALKCLFKKTKKHFKYIVFVDDNDGDENLKDKTTNTARVYDAFVSSPDTTVITYDYTAKDHQEKELTPQQKEEINKKWKEISSTVDRIFGDYSVLTPNKTPKKPIT